MVVTDNIYKSGIWFVSNSELVPKLGTRIFLEGSTGYKDGDGVHKLENLKWNPVGFEPPITTAIDEPIRLITLLVATEDITKYLPVNTDGTIADSSDVNKRGKLLGIAIEDIDTGFEGKVVTQGEVQNSSWSWTTGDLLYLNGGTITNVYPSTGFIQKVGKAKNSSTITIEITIPIRI